MSIRNALLTSIAVLLNSALPSNASTKVVCVGNSITEWSGYVQRLEWLLGTGYTVQNAGSAGKCVLKKAVVKAPVEGPYWGSDAFRSVFTANPTIIIIKLGTNDSKPENWTAFKGEFYKDYSALIDTFLTIKPTPRIYLAFPVPAFSPACCNISPQVIQNEIIPLIDSLGRKRNMPVIDCHTPLLNGRAWFKDGVHPDFNGAQVIAETLYAGLMGTVTVWSNRPQSRALGLPLSLGQSVDHPRFNAQGRVHRESNSTAKPIRKQTRSPLYAR